jgi:hypothetical protein
MTDPPYGEVSGPLRIARLLTFLPRWQPALRAETARTGTWPHGTPSHFTQRVRQYVELASRGFPLPTADAASP